MASAAESNEICEEDEDNTANNNEQVSVPSEGSSISNWFSISKLKLIYYLYLPLAPLVLTS